MLRFLELHLSVLIEKFELLDCHQLLSGHFHQLGVLRLAVSVFKRWQRHKITLLVLDLAKRFFKDLRFGVCKFDFYCLIALDLGDFNT